MPHPLLQPLFVLALLLWLGTALARRILERRRTDPFKRSLFEELGPPMRLLFIYLTMRLARYYVAEDAHVSVWHALEAGSNFALWTGMMRLGDCLVASFFRWRGNQGTPRIVRTLSIWVMTFGIAALVLRTEYKLDLSSLFATSALLSVVLGFALQETLGNLFAGLTLHAEQPFEQGEWVTFGKYSGRVLDVGWRSTRLLTSDEDELLVPNSLIAREVVINHMRPHLSEVIDLPVHIDRDVSPTRAKAVLQDAVLCCPLVLREPVPRVHLTAFTEHGATYRVRFYTEAFHLERAALDQVQEAIWYALRRAAIDIPYPQQSVSFRERAQEAEERRRREHLAEASDLLGRIDFVRALSAEARQTLAERARFQEFGPSQAVVRQGEQGETLYLVARGELAVRVLVESGEKEVARLGRGALFGEMSVLTGEPRTATVISIGESGLLAVDRDAFERILFREPELAQSLAEVIARRKLALDALHAEGTVAQAVEETSNLLSRIGSIFGFQRRPTGT